MPQMVDEETDLFLFVVGLAGRFEIFYGIIKEQKWKAVESRQEWRNKYGIAMIPSVLNTENIEKIQQ